MIDEADLARNVVSFVKSNFGGNMSVIGAHTSLLYSGMMDSLGISELALFLSDTCGIEVRSQDLVENDLDTAALIARYVNAKRTQV